VSYICVSVECMQCLRGCSVLSCRVERLPQAQCVCVAAIGLSNAMLTELEVSAVCWHLCASPNEFVLLLHTLQPLCAFIKVQPSHRNLPLRAGANAAVKSAIKKATSTPRQQFLLECSVLVLGAASCICATSACTLIKVHF
jgi:hypothetical protein